MHRSSTQLLETLKLTEARQELLLDLLRSQRQTSDIEAMMRAASEAVGRHLQVDRVGFFEIEDEMLHFAGGWSSGRLELLATPFPVIGIGTGYLSEVLAGKAIGIDDVAANPLTTDFTFAEIGAVSLIGVPIIRHGVWSAGFYVNHSEVRAWAGDDVELVRRIGEQTWDAIERARAENAWRKSEERLTLAFEAAGGGIGTWDWDLTEDRLYSDARYAWLFSVDPARAALGVPIAEYMRGIEPDDRNSVSEQIGLAVAGGKDYSVEFRVLPPDGSVRWLHARGRRHCNKAGLPVRLPGVVVDITERHQAELQLHRQWRNFDVALSNTPDLNYIFDLQGRFTYANRALLSLLEKSLEGVVGRNFHQLSYPPELATRLQQQIQQVIDTRHPLRDQTPFTAPSGKTGVYEYIFVPVVGANDSVDAVAGSTRDITERNQAEALLEEDRRRWRELLFQAPAAIAILRGPEHRFEWVNDGYTRHVGRSAELLVGKSILQVFPELEGQIYASLLDGVYRTGEPFSGHESCINLVRHDGMDELFVNFVYMPTRDAAGQVDGIFAHITDVTDMVLSRKRIEQSEERFRDLADSMPQIVWTAQPDGTIDYCNKRWFHFSGQDCSAPENRNWLAILHHEDAPRTCETWSTSLRSGDPFQIETRLRDLREDRWRWFMCRAESVRDSSGQVVRWFGTCTDIDEQKTSQQAVLQAQKLDSIGLLAGGIAHDFNNLLVGIMGGASFALTKLSPSHEAHSMLKMILGASERAAHLTRQMLAYAGKGKFVIEPVDISSMASQTTQLVAASIPKSVQVSLQLDPNLPAVETDAGQMQQVVMNLIINAAEAVGESNGLIVVRTRAEEITPGHARRGVDGAAVAPGLYVIFEVRDTGCGIDDSTLSRIFDPFFTTKFTGRGLGLAAVSGVVRSHHGSIEVETEPGKGSTFRVLIPAAKTRPPPASGGVTPTVGGGRETVLVIDDEPVVLQLAKASLNDSGYVVIVAQSAEAALGNIRDKPEIALVLLDISMPGLSGRQLFEAIVRVRPTLPIVICSGYSEDEVYRQLSGLKLAGILQKPFAVTTLATQVRSVLDAS